MYEDKRACRVPCVGLNLSLSLVSPLHLNTISIAITVKNLTQRTAECKPYTILINLGQASKLCSDIIIKQSNKF